MIGPVFRTGWMNLARDRAALILSFLVPIVFFSIFAGIFSSMGDDETARVKVALVDEDGSARSRKLAAALRAESALRVIEANRQKQTFDRAAALEFVRGGGAPVALIIPKGFGTGSVQFGAAATTDAPTVELISDRSDPIAPQVVNGLLQKTAMTALTDLFMQGGIDAADKWTGGLTPEQRSTFESNLKVFQSMPPAQTGAGGAAPIQIKSSDIAGEDKRRPLIAFYAAGIGVMFMLFTASSAGGALLEEQESGTLDRILTTRVTLTGLLLGKLVFLVSLGVVQLIVMFIWGAFVFGLDLWTHIPGFLVMAIATAVACSAFGLLLASIARTRSQLGALSTLVVLTISAFGGSMFPRFLMPEGVQKASLVVFNSWAIDGFLKVFWREEPLIALAPQVAVLLATGVVFFILARQLTRKWELS